MSEYIVAAAEQIASLADAAGLMEIAGYGLRYAIASRLGWLRNAVWESIGRLTGINEASPVQGIPVYDMFGVLLEGIWDALRHQLVTGAPVLHSILATIYGSIYESYSRPVRLALEAALRSRTVTELPQPFDLIWMGEQVEEMDELSLAWIFIMSGAHPAHVVFNVLQGLKWLYDIHLSELRSDVDRLAREFNDVMLMDVDVLVNEVRYWIAEAFRTYHRAVNRLLSVADYIAERSLTRIWEIRLAAMTVLDYFRAGLVNSTTAGKALVRLNEEVERVYELYQEAKKMVEEAFEKLDFEDEINKLLEAINNFKTVYGGWLKTQIYNLLAWKGARDSMKKIDKALWKTLVAKHRIDFEKAIQPFDKYWRIKYPVIPGFLYVLDLEGVASE